MLRLLLLSKLVFLSSYNCFGEEVFKDRAVFRIDGHVYFETDLKSINKLYRSFDCIESSSFNKVMGKLTLSQNGSFNNASLRKIMRFEKLRKFVQAERSVNQNIKLDLKQSKKCSNLSKEVLKIESYLRQRFYNENSSLTKLELKRFSKDNHYKDQASLKKAFEDYQEIKRKESQKLFLKSLVKVADSFEFFHD